VHQILKSVSVLTGSQKREGVFIVVLLAFQSVLDFFSVASFLPLIIFTITPGSAETNYLIKSIYNFFRVPDSGSFVIALAGSVLLLMIVKNLVTLVISTLKARYVFGIGEQLSNRALNDYLNVGYTQFANSDHSKEISRMTSQPLIFANNIILSVATLTSELIVFILIVGCVAIYNISVLVLLLAIIIPVLIFFRFVRSKIKSVGASLQGKYPLTLKYAHQAVEGLIEIKTLAKESFFSQRFARVTKELRAALVKDHVIQSAGFRLTETVTALIVCFLIVYSMLNETSYQETILLLSIYAGASFRLIPSINRILHAFIQIRTNEYILNDLNTYKNFVAPQTTGRRTFHFDSRFELRNISFQYPDRTKILQNISLTVDKGEKLAITGRSGEGKTTLLLLLLGFLKPSEGKIIIDEEEIDPGEFRLMGYVSQNPYILDDSIANNIAFGEAPAKINRDRVLQLINDLELKDVVERLPGGIDANIGEKGVKLSGGQRQRLAIARALYAEAEFLLFDEITNQVHVSAEQEIMKVLDRLAKNGKTIIIVTHKIHSETFYDSIYHLHRGTLVEAIAQP